MNQILKDKIEFANRLQEASDQYERHAEGNDLSKMIDVAVMEIKQLAVSVDQYHQMIEDAEDIKDGNYWSWQGDGNDGLETMGNEMKVVISAAALRCLIEKSLNLSVLENKSNEHKFDRAMEGIG